MTSQNQTNLIKGASRLKNNKSETRPSLNEFGVVSTPISRKEPNMMFDATGSRYGQVA